MIRKLFVLFFQLKGWKIDPHLPAGHQRCVVIAAPHTSNWDFVYALAVFFKLGMPVKFLAKKELFKWPLSILLNAFGGMPVDRKKNNKLVDAMVDLFSENKNLMLLIPAEGTRSFVQKWKTGFYHVALRANVPVLLGYLDYEKKMAGFGPLLTMTGNGQHDAAHIKSFYKDIKGRYPELFHLEGLIMEPPQSP
jgi:1-acyl-sn-glycerol-3-phosphate acyltransferase